MMVSKTLVKDYILKHNFHIKPECNHVWLDSVGPLFPNPTIFTKLYIEKTFIDVCIIVMFANKTVTTYRTTEAVSWQLVLVWTPQHCGAFSGSSPLQQTAAVETWRNWTAAFGLDFQPLSSATKHSVKCSIETNWLLLFSDILNSNTLICFQR